LESAAAICGWGTAWECCWAVFALTELPGGFFGLFSARFGG